MAVQETPPEFPNEGEDGGGDRAGGGEEKRNALRGCRQGPIDVGNAQMEPVRRAEIMGEHR